MATNPDEARSPAGGGGLAARLPPGGSGESSLTDDSLETDGCLEAGLQALTEGRWADAVAALSAAAGPEPATQARHCRALEGLSEALWWMGRVEEALAARARAYAGWRALGHDAPAARAAAWQAREYATAVGNDAASRGWLARAETLARGSGDPEVVGWVALTEAVLATDPRAQSEAAQRALDQARAARSGDLEVLALGRLGLAAVAGGRLDGGLGRLDEAMAAATGGDADLSTLAALCCDLVFASELTGELDRFAQWNAVVESLAGRHGHPSLIAFCSTCCAEALSAAGNWAGAEQQLRAALEMLGRTGHRARCVPPAAKLAELLVSQGRIEEAAQVLEGEDVDAALLVRAGLALARHDPQSAAGLAERHLRRLGGPSLLTAPALALLVDAYLAAGEPDRARTAAGQLRAVGERNGHPRTLGRAMLAEARTVAASDDGSAARGLLEEALDLLTSVAPGALETAQAHLELARVTAADAPQLAVTEARAALTGFEAAGAAAAADAAAALLRDLGDRRHVGAKKVGTLTRREERVLRLLTQGLTNAEIAERLFISPKTASNHVSHILAKLGLRSRTEAATYAALHADD